MSNICFEDLNILNQMQIIEIIDKTRDILELNYKNELNIKEKDAYSKEYRAYRKIDNFAENYIVVFIYNDKCNDYKDINSCGLSYGGIELPIISKVINKNRVEQLLLLKFNKNVSGYSNKQNINLRNFNIYGLCFNSPYSWKDDSWLSDDGKTDYTDSLGVFDLNRKKIIECLIKNHDYNSESEVGEL